MDNGTDKVPLAPARAVDPNEWVSRLESPGTALLAPFTTESTRKAGFQLVIVAALTILFAYDILVVTEGSFAGVKLQATKVTSIVALSALACLYLLGLYAFELFRDWKATYYKRLPAMAQYERLRVDWHNDQKARLAAHNARDAEIDRLLKLRVQKRDELLGEFKADPTQDIDWANPPPDVSERLAARHQRVQARLKRVEEWGAYCAADGLDELQREHLKKALDSTMTYRIDALATLAQTVYRSDRIRFITEVAFPSTLAVCALVLAGAKLLSTV